MTPDHDIEHVLDRWFSEGPTQMPSRFLDDTLDRIDRAPQHRLARLRTRLPAMHPYLRFAAAAAVVVTVAGFGAAVLTRTGGIAGTSPQGSALLPASLQAEWHPVGTRDMPGRSGPYPQDLDIVIAPTRVTVFDYKGDVLNSAQLVGPDRIEVRALNKGMYWHCQVGDVGTYTFRLSAEDKQLSLIPVSDSCAERATILAGDWTRTELGDIAPGRHVSQVFRPFGGGTSGQLSFTVPTGWAESEGAPAGLSLWIPGASDGASIQLFSNVVPVSNSDPGCAASPADASIQHSPAAIAAWLADHPGLVVSTPAPVAIGGLSGVMVDLSVDPAMVACSGLFVDFNVDLNDAHVAALAGERRARYILLDRGDGQMLLITIDASDKATWDAALADAMQIVDSFEFTR
jgi:hypothetical protein